MADEYILKDEVLNLIEHNDKVCHYADERYENVVYATTRTICKVVAEMTAADVQPIDDDNGHIIYIGRKAYLAENTIMEFMKKMDIIRDSLAYIENLVDEGLRRLDFWAIADNPVNKMYRKLVDRWCGYEVGRMHECHYFGGKYHDSILYEILF